MGRKPFDIPNDSLLPRSYECLSEYRTKTFIQDLIAGVTVGLVALPLALAFAISSGMPPQAGITCAVVAGFLISLLGGSKVQIGGPTGAFVVVVSGIIAKHGIDGLYMCTMMAGVVLVLLAVTRLGTAVKFIPRPVVIGFTNGIAVLIASTQIKDFLGLQIDKVPGEFLGRMGAIAGSLGSYSPQALTIGLATLLVVIGFTRFAGRVPGSVVSLVVLTGLVWWLQLPIETVGGRFGVLPSGLPTLRLPTFRPDLILPLLSPTITVAMLGAIESLLSAVVADQMAGDKHRPNAELLAQGIANIASPLVGGLPATGAIARTATNVRSGAKTPVAGMIHAATLALVLLTASRLAEHIPLCVLAAILLTVAWNMGEWREIPEVLRQSKADVAVWALTFLLTVFADLTVAVEVGMMLAALLFIQRVTTTTSVSRVTPEYIEAGFAHSLQTNELPDGVAVYRIHGPFLFGSSDKLSLIEEELESLPKVVMLRIRNMTALDATGLHAFEHLADRLHETGRELILCGARAQPLRLMNRTEFHRHVGEENIQPNLSAAIERAKAILG
ncbi:MAG: STAS domain-containing protein [Armatimonadetes bacterium]|nr:STAS domain-containing protein [Armatimonadota bacterium]